MRWRACQSHMAALASRSYAWPLTYRQRWGFRRPGHRHTGGAPRVGIETFVECREGVVRAILRDDGGEDVLLGFAGGDHFVDHEIDLAPMSLGHAGLLGVRHGNSCLTREGCGPGTRHDRPGSRTALAAARRARRWGWGPVCSDPSRKAPIRRPTGTPHTPSFYTPP